MRRASKKGLWSGRPAFLAVLVLALGLLIAACGGDDDANGEEVAVNGNGNGEEISVYLNPYSQEIQYFRDWVDGATDAAEELGWTVSSEFGNGTPEQQIQQIENAIVQQPDGMLITAIDEDSILPVARQASEAGIAVITVGGTVADETVPASYVARDNVDIGRDKANYVVEQLGGEGTVGVIHGIRGLTFSEEQDEGYFDVLDNEPGIEVIDGPYVGGFSADLGLDATSNLLTRNPGIDAIIYDNDDLALGGSQAVRDAGIDLDDIILVGTDGGEEALDAVEDGRIDMTISLCGYAEGANAISVLNDYLETGDVESRIVTEVLEFNSENVEQLRADTPREECA